MSETLFNKSELRWIQELVEDEIFRRKQDDIQSDYDKDIFRNILEKITKLTTI